MLSESIVHNLLPIQLLCLSPYASWLNPIEKLWRWMKQEVLPLHRLVEEFEKLQGQDRFFSESLR